MQETELATFNAWIARIPQDAEVLLEAALSEAVPSQARRLLLGSLDYLPRQFDLIPDHWGGMGALDDAFVLRVGAMLARKAGLGPLRLDLDLDFQRLAADTDTIRSLLGDVYPLLVAYVVRLPDLEVRGRTADRILADPQVRDQFLRELRHSLQQPAPPPLSDEAALEQIRRFIRDRGTLSLPAG
ncbi:MAG: hypothetical protein RMK29_19800 [Myxococcales bacterium]|nr:DUF1232 domain-containing protein [Myxococcota bacterium]MDW8283953.1 hypothetical protein [Myxococcales bacterium]